MKRMDSKSDNGREFSSDDDASPRCVMEAPVSETESDSTTTSSSSSSSFSPEKLPLPLPPPPAVAAAALRKTNSKESNLQQWKTMIDVFKFKSVKKLTTIPLLSAGNEITRKGFAKKLARIRSAEDSIDIGVIPTKPSWRNFDYAELAAATNDFNPENLVGKGGHAEVYKGHLPDGKVIAVKRLMKNAKDAGDRAGDFLTELGIIAHINHPNATRLVGFGIERGHYFVLEYAPHGSLSSLLFGGFDAFITWNSFDIRLKTKISRTSGIQLCGERDEYRNI
ncbi:hypothetical protein S83_014291 [Arachis hypogaea]